MRVAAMAAVLLWAVALAAPPGADMVEMEVLGVVALEDGESCLLVLAQKDGQAVLTPVIGRAEASAIDLALQHVTPPRPMTHDLLEKVIARLGGAVERVEIDGLKDSTFLATLRVKQGRRALAIDARPSDSVALALRARAPVFASRRVVEAAGLSRSDLERLRREPGRPPSRQPPSEGTQRL
ncbi:MAG TPA: bifunctional nuclease family protein [Anaeromyxobacteraceae bacterium]|nr:bifunctional nuclease family protein [Anaeromyxobacteraceae bacterium]